jgi:hypothetical protein
MTPLVPRNVLFLVRGAGHASAQARLFAAATEQRRVSA